MVENRGRQLLFQMPAYLANKKQDVQYTCNVNLTPSHIDCYYVNATMLAVLVVDLTVNNIKLLRPVMEMQEWFPLALFSP